MKCNKCGDYFNIETASPFMLEHQICFECMRKKLFKICSKIIDIPNNCDIIKL